MLVPIVAFLLFALAIALLIERDATRELLEVAEEADRSLAACERERCGGVRR
jgi:hypothetical protein